MTTSLDDEALPALSDDERAVLERCSNRGRWGADDELGTLNLIDGEVRRRAAGLVRDGTVVRLGRPLPVDGSTVARHPVVHRMLLPPNHDTAIDSVTVTGHDPQITHVDALGHTFLAGRAYNGRRRSDVLGPGGLSALSIASLRDGVFCRGVLLDVAAARGVDHLPADAYVTAADLDEAERRSGTTVGPGDAVVVHVGRAERLLADDVPDVPVPRAGLHLDALPWLRERDVAVFLGDCTERLPPEEVAIPLPLHQIASVVMGLCMIDGALTSELVHTCRALDRSEFLLCCTIPEIPGATGFPVNPICLF
jgi:hypothetical protein